MRGSAREKLVDAGEGFGDGALHCGGEREGEDEGLCADGEEIRAFGDAAVELVAHEKKQCGIAGVREQGVVFAAERSDGLQWTEPGEKRAEAQRKKWRVTVMKRRDLRGMTQADEEFSRALRLSTQPMGERKTK
jgi:hypothetical protein